MKEDKCLPINSIYDNIIIIGFGTNEVLLWGEKKLKMLIAKPLA